MQEGFTTRGPRPPSGATAPRRPEAIFLSTFVMVSQNRQAARENVRADLDFET
ncbi:DUF1003 domain-containing protein, partial [Streptomyces sp. NPDC004230]